MPEEYPGRESPEAVKPEAVKPEAVEPDTGEPDAAELVEWATTLLLTRPPGLGRIRLGVVDGPSGSGKSTFAEHWRIALREAGLSCALFSSDLLATWDDPFGWFDRFDDQVFGPLATGRPGRIQLTDWSSGEPVPGDWRDIPVSDALILEGVSSGRVALGDRASVQVWVHLAGRRQRLDRAVGRDGESARARLAAWQDAEDAFFDRDRPASRADIRACRGP